MMSGTIFLTLLGERHRPAGFRCTFWKRTWWRSARSVIFSMIFCPIADLTKNLIDKK